MKPTKIAGFYSPSDQKLHELSDFSLGSSSDFFDSDDAKHQFCLKNNTLFKFIPETGSFTQLASLPKGTFFARFLDDSLLAVNGELNVRNEKREWRRVKLRKPPKYCPHGVASTSNDKISIKSLVLGFSTFVIVDENGQLWTFERNSLLDNGNTSITPRRLPFMGGMRKCTRIVGGRKHFLALVVRSVAEQKGFDCDDIEDNISRKIQMNEVKFQNCDKCQEDGKMRLSATMKLADQEHDDVLRFLEADEEFKNLRLNPESSIQRKNGERSLKKTNLKPNQLKKLHAGKMENRQRSCSSNEENKEKSSVMSFLSIDRLSLQMRQDNDSPTSSAHPTLRKKKQIFEVPDDFVEVWSWGDNSAGQLGHGDSVNRKEPFPISTLTEYHVVEIACGEQFSMALTANGEVLSWGESLQPSTSLTFNSTPQILKIGYDQIALGICAFKEQSAILISSTNGPSFILHSTKDAVTRNRSIQKLPPFVKDHICVETSVLESTLGFKTLKRSAQVEECFTFWAEAVKLGRLLRALAKMSQHMHENSRASCAEDQSAIVADLLHKFYLSTVCAAGSIAGLSASLRQLLITGESLDSVEILNRCVTSDFTNALLHYFDALCDAVAFGCFVRISVSSEIDQQISKLCLVYGAESSSLASRVQKLCFKGTSFWSTLKCSASELMAVEANSTRRRHLQDVITKIQENLNHVNQSISDARRTNKYWQKPFDENTIALLRASGRKLLICMPINGDGGIVKASTIHPKTLIAPKYIGVLVFNDVLIFLEKKDYKLWPLELIWLQNETESTNPSLSLIAPEAQLLLEFKSDVERNKFMAASESWSTKKPASQKRFGQYKFTNPSSDLIDSTYQGSWLCGKPNGRGILRYEDETCYEGQFVDGEYHGFGVLTVPHFTQTEKDSSFSSFFLGSPTMKTEKVTEFKGVFRRGKLCGLGRIRYPNGDFYEGYCEGNEPHGFGLHQWDRGKYLGGWKDGKRHGYGVHSTRKARYLGEFNNDKLQGRGSRITIDGCYHEGNWVDDLITHGRIICPPKAAQPHFSVEYEGDFEDYGSLTGKGLLKVAPNTLISGQFSGDLLSGDQVQMNNTQMYIKEKPIKLREINGQLMVEEGETTIERFYNEEGPQESSHVPPASQRWQKMFNIFIEEELGGNFTESALVWQRIVSGIRKGKEMRGKIHETGPCPQPVLERIPPYEDAWSPGYRTMLTEYFNAAINYEPHPLWRLCHGSIDLFVCSYNNMATHAAMYSQSTLELRSLIEENYKVIRLLFSSLPENPYEVFAESLSRRESSTNGTNSSSESSPDGSPAKTSKSDPLPPIEAPTPACEFLYEFFFPKVSPTLSTIYSLSIAELDSIYWRKALYLNAHTDIKLLEYFLVPKELWPIEMPVVNDLEKPLIRALARKKFYESAILALQQLPTDANPSTKLAILVDTFEEISQCVLNYADAGSDHVWGGDDQFPVMIYIVVRAGIQHLGSEIRLLDNFTREFRSGHAVDMMFTMLKAAYVQILTDKWVA